MNQLAWVALVTLAGVAHGGEHLVHGRTDPLLQAPVRVVASLPIYASLGKL